jgi:hypothetical protein
MDDRVQKYVNISYRDQFKGTEKTMNTSIVDLRATNLTRNLSSDFRQNRKIRLDYVKSMGSQVLILNAHFFFRELNIIIDY